MLKRRRDGITLSLSTLFFSFSFCFLKASLTGPGGSPLPLKGNDDGILVLHSIFPE